MGCCSPPVYNDNLSPFFWVMYDGICACFRLEKIKVLVFVCPFVLLAFYSKFSLSLSLMLETAPTFCPSNDLEPLRVFGL